MGGPEFVFDPWYPFLGCPVFPLVAICAVWIMLFEYMGLNLNRCPPFIFLGFGLGWLTTRGLTAAYDFTMSVNWYPVLRIIGLGIGFLLALLLAALCGWLVFQAVTARGDRIARRGQAINGNRHLDFQDIQDAEYDEIPFHPRPND